MADTPQQTSDEIAKAKVQLHLRLTYEDWKETFKQLRTRSEIGVFYAIRTLDPFGDRALDIDCAALGDELGLHRTTVSDALKLLNEKKLIDLEITKARVKQKISNRRLTLLTAEENGSNQEKKEEKTMRVPALTCESPASHVSPQPHSRVPSLTAESPASNQPPEPLPPNDSKTPQTIQTYSDFIQTLSEGERENFEKFVREEWKKLKGEEILSLERFLGQEEDFKNWHQKFKNFSNKEGKNENARLKPSEKRRIIQELRDKDWKKDPRHDEWLPQAYRRGLDWYLQPETKISEAEALERSLFYDWCEDTKAFAPFQGIP